MASSLNGRNMFGDEMDESEMGFVNAKVQTPMRVPSTTTAAVAALGSATPQVRNMVSTAQATSVVSPVDAQMSRAMTEKLAQEELRANAILLKQGRTEFANIRTQTGVVVNTEKLAEQVRATGARAPALDNSSVTEAMLHFNIRHDETKLPRLPGRKPGDSDSGVPMLELSLKRGNVSAEFDDPEIRPKLASGELSAIAQSVEVNLTTDIVKSLNYEIVGIKARKGERGFGEGQGWLRGIVTADQLRRNNGTISLKFERPLGEDNAQLIANYGHILFGKGLEKTFTYVPALKMYMVLQHSPVANVYNSMESADSRQPLHPPLHSDDGSTGMVALPKEPFEQCLKETIDYRDREFALLDLENGFALRLWPSAYTDAHGNRTYASFNPIEQNKQNQAVISPIVHVDGNIRVGLRLVQFKD